MVEISAFLEIGVRICCRTFAPEKNHTIMQYTTLSNGIQMPLLGYGVFQVPPQEAERCVADALCARGAKSA